MKTFEPIRKRRTVTAAFAAQKLQVTPRTIRNYQAEERSTYEATAAARRQQAHDLKQQDMTWAQVGEAMGCTAEAAMQLGKRYRAMAKANSGTA